MGNKDRGSTTHGHGSSKKKRGKGNRGGRGRAGYGKKATHKVISASKESKRKKGFNLPQKTKRDVKTINLYQIDQKIEQFVEQGAAEEKEKGDTDYVFYAEKADIDKILGKGKITTKIEIRASDISKKAKEKIKSAGGNFVKTDEESK